MSQRIRRVLVTTAMVVVSLVAWPAPARADLTAFFGFSPTPETRQTRGVSIGKNIALLAGEFEITRTTESTTGPRLETYMFDGQIHTPGKHQLYLTFGFGHYRETLGGVARTGGATNVGGGLKVGLAGPIKLRVDYRTFTLDGAPVSKNPKRFYAGLSVAF